MTAGTLTLIGVALLAGNHNQEMLGYAESEDVEEFNDSQEKLIYQYGLLFTYLGIATLSSIDAARNVNKINKQEDADFYGERKDPPAKDKRAKKRKKQKPKDRH